MGHSKKKRETVAGWPGYIHRQGNGRPVFIIEKQVGGKRFHVSTRANNITAAMAQLARFQSNPEAYEPSGSIGRPVRITGKLVLDFEEWQRTVKGVSRRHAFYVAKYLADWTDDIGNRDLRALQPSALREMVGKRTARPHRIAALKVFFGWLRLERGLLRSHQDATLDIRVPQSTPEKHRRRKVLDFDSVQSILPHLSGDASACVTLLCATGWHYSELARFARVGELRPRDDGSFVAITPHKSGELTRTPLEHKDHVEAATRLRKRGLIPAKLRKMLIDASEAAGLPREKRVTPGVFRHSVATWAVEDGASVEQVSRFLGHKDVRTTRRFYVDMREPTASIPVRVLHRRPRRESRASRTVRASSPASKSRS